MFSSRMQLLEIIPLRNSQEFSAITVFESKYNDFEKNGKELVPVMETKSNSEVHCSVAQTSMTQGFSKDFQRADRV